MGIYLHWEQFKMVWRFYSGITMLKNKEFFDYILPYKLIKSPFSQCKMLELIYFAYEANCSKVFQIAEEYFSDDSFVIDLDQLESHAINYFLAHYRGPVRLRRRCFKLLIDWSLQCNKDLNLEEIAVQHYNSIHELDINDTTEFKLTLQILSNSKTLKIIRIHAMHDKIESLANSKSNSLQEFVMSYCDLNSNKVDIIGKMLSHNKSIKSMNISNNCIVDVGVKKLVHYLKDNSTLQHIDLRSNGITEVGANHLRELIKRDHSTLTSIELSDNPLKDKGVDLILQSLSIGIKHIGLCNVEMTSLSYQSLTFAFHQVKSISFDQLIDCSVVSIQQMSGCLTSTTVLEHLEIRLPAEVSTCTLLYLVEKILS